MKLFSSMIAFLGCVLLFTNCTNNKSADGAAYFCDTACITDSVHFENNSANKSYINIKVTNCKADSVTWGNKKMLNDRQLPFADLLGRILPLNKNKIKAYFHSDDYVWLMINECENGQGYIVKLPFNEKDNIFRKNSGLNSLDPKYTIAENMVAYTDRGNIFVEDMATGKKGTMTFGEALNVEYDHLHDAIDSVSVTPTHVWAKVKIGKEWKVIEKDITLE